MDWILPFRFVQNPDKSSTSIFKVAQTHAPLHSCILKNPCDERPIARARSHIRNKADVWKRKPPSPSRLRNCKAAWQHSSYCKFDHLSNHWFCGRAGLAIAILAMKTWTRRSRVRSRHGLMPVKVSNERPIRTSWGYFPANLALL